MSEFSKEGAFVVEHAKDQGTKKGRAVFQVNQEPYLRFLKDRGISKSTIEQVHAAESDYLNGTIHAARTLLEKNSDAEQLQIRTRTPVGRIDTTIKKTSTSKNPSTGEPIVKHGAVSVRFNLKKVMNKDLLEETAAAIAKIA